MKIAQKTALVALLALFAAAAVGVYLTSGSAPRRSARSATVAPNPKRPTIDRRYLDTALRLADFAATSDEQRAAKSALDAADHELDLQYAYALQLAAIEPIADTPQIRSIQDRITRIEATIKTRQTELDQLQSAIERATGSRRDSLEEQQDISAAELNLSREMLADAKDELTQAGGDPHSQLQELKDEHDAASKADDTFKFPSFSLSAPAPSLIAKYSYWKSVRSRRSGIQQAQSNANAAAEQLTQQQIALEKEVDTEQMQRQALNSHQLTAAQISALIASNRPQPPPPKSVTSQPEGSPVLEAGLARANSTVVLIQGISSGKAMIRILGARIRAMKDLSSAYANWSLLIESAERRALHSIIVGALWITLLLILAFSSNLLIDRLLGRLSLERKQKSTLRSVFRISVELIVALTILLIIFGKPSQLSTVLGLAGAGLAIALQDILISFLGWFVLMGRNGIRVGDWVEINPNSFTGVRGEVIEITLLRTVLLETDNWTEPGHPTGRQVAFMNMYAVSGYYFNFTTSGQWLWDELQVLIPAGRNPSPLLEKLRAIATKETQGQTELAEREWQRVSRRYGMRSLSAKPSVNLKLTDNGLTAIVRYITRVDERAETRYRINHELVQLLHGGEELVAASEVLPSASDRQ
jgi:small-conductance mechanosensitive channel